MKTMNKVTKSWQNYKKLTFFAKEYEEFIEYQDAVVRRTFLDLNLKNIKWYSI